jgi:hypothetical protein
MSPRGFRRPARPRNSNGPKPVSVLVFDDTRYRGGLKAIVKRLERQRIRMRVFLVTGAGVSAESGLGTFRDKGGTGIWTRFAILRKYMRFTIPVAET